MNLITSVDQLSIYKKQRQQRNMLNITRYTIQHQNSGKLYRIIKLLPSVRCMERVMGNRIGRLKDT